MRFKRPIYRYLFYTGWVVLLSGIITLLVAANGRTKARACKGIVVAINNGGDRIYVEQQDVLKNIAKAAQGPIVGKHTGNINLALLEKKLEKNPWIRDAELYFDTRDLLHVAISERVPIARVFTIAGTSFYIDSAGHQLPLLDAYSAKLPVVTGFTAAKRLNKADSLMLQQVKEVVKTISADAFWNAQVGQIDITPDRKFELVPVIGSHLIKMGSGTDVEEKLAKLMVFYKQVLPKAGFAKYSALDVQFDGQVVAVKKGPTSPVDSIQLQKNIEELMMRKAAEQEPDDAVAAVPNIASLSSGDFDRDAEGKDTLNKTIGKEKSTAPEKKSSATSQSKTAASQKPYAAKGNQPLVKPAQNKAAALKPKAVMKPKVQNG